jgi:hypothetical protein
VPISKQEQLGRVEGGNRASDLRDAHTSASLTSNSSH